MKPWGLGFQVSHRTTIKPILLKFWTPTIPQTKGANNESTGANDKRPGRPSRILSQKKRGILDACIHGLSDGNNNKS